MATDAALDRNQTRLIWPVAAAVAVSPVVAIVVIALVMRGQDTIGPLTGSQVLWFVLAPLAIVFPVVAAGAALRSDAPGAVVVGSSLVPTLVVAIQLLQEPASADRAGRTHLLGAFLERVSLPIGVLIVTFLALWLAEVMLRRPGSRWVAIGFLLSGPLLALGWAGVFVGWSYLDWFIQYL